MQLVRNHVARLASQSATRAHRLNAVRSLATVAPVASGSHNHKIVVVGSGSAGIALSHQLLRKGNFKKDDIAVIDPAIWHHYQPGWTLVGGGLKDKDDLRRPIHELIEPKLNFYNKNVAAINPKENYLTLGNGDTINYEQLVVAPGVTVDYSSVKGLSEAMANPDSLVGSIYSYDYCDKVSRNIERLEKGAAIFTQPAGVVKCAGAPQKIMWLALDHWRRAGRYKRSPDESAIKVTFATGLPTMFGVPKYSVKLNELREERGVEGLFEHNLVSIDGNTATFDRPAGKEQVKRDFDFLHVAPRNVPPAFIKESGLGNEAGYVDVNQHTLRHAQFKNVWSIGDASSLPTSKTVAAITSQAPVLTNNLLLSLEGKEPSQEYDGYTSCPLLTGEKEVLLAEFKYGGVPKETFSEWFGIDQVEPRRAFYHLKKDFFPWVYNRYHVKGQWGGPKGWI
ncbi:Sulfide:quinone oxidoreductase mitochondrial precursor [Paraphoma chrysanthemicola]|uniref:Sulfide:quinone oxidoreductase mitochondrial n=1 Tax=Paraphoma chrysanthemicola TaxID=798071 RepID=A0A8K0VYT4_9PLEO|nr:Sulfide:quinone oxidoreductase mitochondrial precursor [Paraphoma chrysanthemicola]